MDFGDDVSLIRFMDDSFAYFFLSTQPVSQNVLIIFAYVERDEQSHSGNLFW